MFMVIKVHADVMSHVDSEMGRGMVIMTLVRRG